MWVSLRGLSVGGALGLVPEAGWGGGFTYLLSDDNLGGPPDGRLVPGIGSDMEGVVDGASPGWLGLGVCHSEFGQVTSSLWVFVSSPVSISVRAGPG